MKVEKPNQVQKIIDEEFPRIIRGESTLEDVLAAHPEQAQLLRLHLESAMWLNKHQDALDPDQRTLSKGKHQLVSIIRMSAPRNSWERLWRQHPPQRLAAQSLSLGLLVLSLVLVIHTFILASRLALPGDVLYPAKRNIEQFQLALTFDPQEQARLQIDFTQRRTTEIVELVLEDDYAHLPQAVEQLEVQIDRTVSDIDIAWRKDGIEAEILAARMKTLLENEAFIMTLLRDMEPTFAYVGLNQAIAITITSLTELQN